MLAITGAVAGFQTAICQAPDILWAFDGAQIVDHNMVNQVVMSNTYGPAENLEFSDLQWSSTYSDPTYSNSEGGVVIGSIAAERIQVQFFGRGSQTVHAPRWGNLWAGGTGSGTAVCYVRSLPFPPLGSPPFLIEGSLVVDLAVSATEQHGAVANGPAYQDHGEVAVSGGSDDDFYLVPIRYDSRTTAASGVFYFPQYPGIPYHRVNLGISGVAAAEVGEGHPAVVGGATARAECYMDVRAYRTVPKLQVKPPVALEFEAIPRGQSLVKHIKVSNIGHEQSILEVDISGDFHPFRVHDDDRHFQLKGGTSRNVRVTFQPFFVRMWRDTIRISSNDPEPGSWVDLELFAATRADIEFVSRAYIPLTYATAIVPTGPYAGSGVLGSDVWVPTIPTKFTPAGIVDQRMSASFEQSCDVGKSARVNLIGRYRITRYNEFEMIDSRSWCCPSVLFIPELQWLQLGPTTSEVEGSFGSPDYVRDRSFCVEFEGHASPPYLPGLLAIDWAGTLDIDFATGHLMVYSQIDDFPAYELWVHVAGFRPQLLYDVHPITGPGIFSLRSLYGPEYIPVTRSYTLP